MCRITAIKGNLNKETELGSLIDKLQEYGGTIKQETFVENDLQIFLNRFDITTSLFKSGEFPLENKNIMVAYNGEVYAFREYSFVESDAESDVHFAFELIEKYGHKAFFMEADFEGTFMVYDKKKKTLFVYVDQLNTKGCFYAIAGSNILVTQELSVLHKLLKFAKAGKNVVIQSLKRGHCLEVTYNNTCNTYEYKPDFKGIWNGNCKRGINTRAKKLYKAFKNAVAIRIPKEGEFGVLCGGGIDSSLLLKTVVDVLKKKQLHRLKIFTLGTPYNPLKGEDNDWENVNYLLDKLNLQGQNLFEVVYPFSDWNEFLIDTEVLLSNSHLITPNPVQTQVRHTITMSTVLAQIAINHPEIKVVLTGDFADEIFAGYNSMHTGKIEALKRSIQNKLDDLHLNDAARVTLASLRGCKYVVKMFIEGKLRSSPFTKHNASQHPVEVRTPFASPLIAQVLESFPATDLVGKYKGKTHSKYILRLAAEYAGVPEKIAWRKKIPFNEGGTGIRNTEPYIIEENATEIYFSDNENMPSISDTAYLTKLGISNSKKSFEFAIFCASMRNGLKELIQSDTFRDKMPDSNYASAGDLDLIYSNSMK